MEQFTPPEIWKCHAVYVGIPAGSSNTEISHGMNVNL